MNPTYSIRYKALVQYIINEDAVSEFHNIVPSSCIDKIIKFDNKSYSPIEYAVTFRKVRVLKYLYELPLDDRIDKLMIEQLTNSIRQNNHEDLFNLLMQETISEKKLSSLPAPFLPQAPITPSTSEETLPTNSKPSLSTALTTPSTSEETLPTNSEPSLSTALTTPSTSVNSLPINSEIIPSKNQATLSIDPSLAKTGIPATPLKDREKNEYFQLKQIDTSKISNSKIIEYFVDILKKGEEIHLKDKSFVGEMVENILNLLYLPIQRKDLNQAILIKKVSTIFLKKMEMMDSFTTLLEYLTNIENNPIFLFQFHLEFFKLSNEFYQGTQNEKNKIIMLVESLLYLQKEIALSPQEKYQIYIITAPFVNKYEELQRLNDVFESLTSNDSSQSKPCCTIL